MVQLLEGLLGPVEVRVISRRLVELCRSLQEPGLEADESEGQTEMNEAVKMMLINEKDRRGAKSSVLPKKSSAPKWNSPLPPA